MSRIKITLVLALTALSAFLLVLSFSPAARAALRGLSSAKANVSNDADLPPGSVGTPPAGFSKEDFMIRRAEGVAARRGISKDTPFDPQARGAAIRQMESQEALRNDAPSGFTTWTPLGPAPIPNGQFGPVSGRTIAIAVHPTNPNLVYAGAAQGGLYRSTDGGANWTPILDGALSLAIGALAIAPSQPETLYVGTGEAGFCGDCFFGVGVYRIDNASSATPTISGPFNDETTTDADVFTGRSIGEIVVHPTDAGIIFVGSASGSGGIGGQPNAVLPNRGLFRSTNATSADPSFTKLALAGTTSVNNAIVDIVMDPGNPDLVLCTMADALNANEGGVYRSTDALAATPTFTRTFTAGLGVTNSRTELALHRSGGGVVTVYAASGTAGGTVQRSIDGGATFTQRIDNNFCTAQCFYDIAVAVDPINADRVYLGGSPTLVFGVSTNGGTSFTTNAQTAVGLHVDSHAITVAPSQPSTIYFGSDGGIYKSIDSGMTWNHLNTTQYFATQFMGLSLHPTDRFFTIGGTQDNGTNFYRPNQTWVNVEGGDGGYTQIDQNSPNTTDVLEYHTFFNQTNAMGYSRSLDAGNSWQFFGCGFGGSTPNGMTCAASACNFYAPLEKGGGNPNSLYFGSDVLYRSTNAGVTMAKVSQEPIQAGVAISAIGIAPQDDNVRVVGQNNGNLFGTTTGANPLTNLDAGNAIPNNYIGRVVIDPNNSNTAYVTLAAFGVVNVWKTTNLNAVNPTWLSAASGIPQVPVSAFVIDPQNSNRVYAGTDIGVYQSTDGGANWSPLGTGLPRVAVFDAEISNVHRILRIATHGRGIYEIEIPGTGLPIPRPAGNGTSGPGGASALVAESCAPANGAIDPNEGVTVSYSVQNVGGGPTTNLVATLQQSGGVLFPGTSQNYGAIAAGATASRNFTFTARGNCGDTITLTFQLQDGATNHGTVSVTYVLGALITSPAVFTENFDGVVAPALPAGWTTAQVGTAPLWATTTAFSDTAPNSAATDGTASPGDNRLDSPVIAIPAAPGSGTNPGVQLSFRNDFNTEGGFDGGVLEISINGGAFADILAAGGSFAAGGYNGTIGVTDNVLTGRQAWTGNGNGFRTTIVNLPAAAFSQNAQFRWRTGYDTGTHPIGGGMRIDTISVNAVTRQCCDSPLSVTGAFSRKIHGGTAQDIDLLNVNFGTECRFSAGNHRLVFTFTNNVVNGSATVTGGTGVAGTPTFAGNTMTVDLTGVADVQKLRVTLSGVTDSSANVLPNKEVSVIMLVGDTTGNKVVNTSDVGQTKAETSNPVGATNFRNDVNVDNAITTSDIGLVKSVSGFFVP